jgi:hypothetical protein
MKKRAKDAAKWLGLFLLIGTGLFAYLSLKHFVHNLIFIPLIEWMKRSDSWTVTIFVGAASVIGTGIVLRIIWSFIRPRGRPDAP